MCKLRPILVVTKPDISSATDWLHHRVQATLQAAALKLSKDKTI